MKNLALGNFAECLKDGLVIKRGTAMFYCKCCLNPLLQNVTISTIFF